MENTEQVLDTCEIFWSLYEFSHQGAPVKRPRDIKESLEMLLITGVGKKRGSGSRGCSGEAVANFPWLDQQNGAGRHWELSMVLNTFLPPHPALLLNICGIILQK